MLFTMKDEEFLQKARENRVALIADLEEKKKLQRIAAWGMLGILVLNMTVALFSDRRWIDYGPLFEGVMMAVFAATSLYYDALIKTLKLQHET